MSLSPFARLGTALFHSLDPETAHEAAIKALALGLAPGSRPGSRKDDPALATRCMGLRFPNPVGLGAGFDKNARVPGALARLGFGHVECGTVTPRPQPGNPAPRLFRLSEDRAIINRMGFNGCGIEAFTRNLIRYRTLEARRARPNGVPIGVNLGINKTGARPLEDYPALVAQVSPWADYITINLSSPNTPGLRDLQSATSLRAILDAILDVNPDHPPLAVKLAPDLDPDALPDIVEAAVEGGAAGLIVSNTTLARPPSLRSVHAAEAGGLSGRPLAQRAIVMLDRIVPLVDRRLAVISCGGIESGFDVLQRLRAGASMVQLYTALIYHGPALVQQIKRELLHEMRRIGAETVADLAP
ncbi:quinone-dependent dihydroorotate dehydrogenase [Swaminathania salitolerans]|uniref:Dihydroorotate dehydrogenase (quinone) n=1 Tax=Swaminathania salitolerans TaxID=182838 RepID=A0A511BNJ5_9PROT|nr:quinone-dependent dihydroorotate dehydrogenase [Swaminathania salitolerans]GBQ14854.1 dihydroorotate dehydrogenase 2 [Swaminathania salitolerans LMG 21291]GEL01910.1 dihydroorotate dehydrogenase (quinone) [Swaminathania salitolerans]